MASCVADIHLLECLMSKMGEEIAKTMPTISMISSTYEPPTMKMPLATNTPLTSTLVMVTAAVAAAAAADTSIDRLGSANALLQKASRKLDAYQQFDGSSSIRFSKCVDIKTLPDNYDVDDDSVLSSMKSGNTLSAKSYVLFHMCDGDTCYEDEEYIVDINTYTKNMASYYANYEGTICQACNKYAASFCSSGSSNNNNNNYYGNRELKKFDCDECSKHNCFSQYNAYNYNDAINNLIDDISDCLRTGSYASKGEELYVGPMCSASGNGVELALFLDNKCTTYTTQKSFASLPSYYMYSSAYVFNATKASFQKAFNQTVSCEDMEIANPYNQANDDGANYNGYGDMNPYCQQLFEGGGALGLSSCSSNNGNYYGNQNQNNGNNYGNNQGDDFLSWYTYDMTNNNAQDIYQVCSTVSQMGGSYINYYDSSKSGTWNNEKSKSKSNRVVGSLEIGDVNESTLVVGIAVCFFLLGALVGGVWYYKKEQAKLTDKLEPLNNETFESVRTEGVMT